jgi:hypothetical protein
MAYTETKALKQKEKYSNSRSRIHPERWQELWLTLPEARREEIRKLSRLTETSLTRVIHAYFPDLWEIIRYDHEKDG